jgi:Biotin-lipoyl like
MGEQPAGVAGKRRLRTVIIVAVLAVAVYFGGRALGLWGADDGRLKLYGNVEIREVQLGFRVGGRIDRILVDEGDMVKPGEVLARLDTRPIDDRLAGADARYEAASASANRDVNGLRPQEIGSAPAGPWSTRASSAAPMSRPPRPRFRPRLQRWRRPATSSRWPKKASAPRIAPPAPRRAMSPRPSAARSRPICPMPISSRSRAARC